MVKAGAQVELRFVVQYHHLLLNKRPKCRIDKNN